MFSSYIVTTALKMIFFFLIISKIAEGCIWENTYLKYQISTQIHARGPDKAIIATNLFFR